MHHSLWWDYRWGSLLTKGYPIKYPLQWFFTKALSWRLWKFFSHWYLCRNRYHVLSLKMFEKYDGKKTCNQPSFTKNCKQDFTVFLQTHTNLNPEKSKCILLPLFYSEKEYFSFCSFCVTLHWVPSNILLHINLRPLALTSLATWSLHFQSDLKGWTVLLQTK